MGRKGVEGQGNENKNSNRLKGKCEKTGRGEDRE